MELSRDITEDLKKDLLEIISYSDQLGKEQPAGGRINSLLSEIKNHFQMYIQKFDSTDPDTDKLIYHLSADAGNCCLNFTMKCKYHKIQDIRYPALANKIKLVAEKAERLSKDYAERKKKEQPTLLKRIVSFFAGKH